MRRVSEEGTYPVAIDTALGSAFRENAAKIFGFIYAKVGNREVAEDLTSQVFVKAARWLERVCKVVPGAIDYAV